MPKRLEQELFENIVENTPLISIDLIVRNREGKVLLGQRRNRPAQNYWFVPGGRIFKDETFEIAFERITSDEIGHNILFCKADFLGIYEHFYDDNFSEGKFTTHYVVHGYECYLQPDESNFPVSQHNAYRWFDVEELLDNNLVHQYTKNYFIGR